MDALQLITSIGSPLALMTALLFYFGWVRSQAQAKAFGTDLSVFAMSTQELVLRSIDGLFVPAMVLLLIALLGLRLHKVMMAGPRPAPRLAWLRLPRWMRAPRTVWIRRLARLLGPSWIVILAVAVLLLVVATEVGRATLPLWISLAILCPAYASFLTRRAIGDQTRTSRPIIAVVVMLLTLSLFLLTERFANLAGEARAQDIKDNISDRLPAAIVHSVHDLHITAPYVSETRIATGEAGSFQYRYEGLYLLQRSGGKYFLVSDGWDEGRGRLIPVPDNESIRLDFG